MPHSVKLNQEEKNEPHWYLGIDFGTTGIAAVLLNVSNGKQYPLYWLSNNDRECDKSSFRLPTAVYCHPQSEKNQINSPLTIAWEALSFTQTRGGIFFENLKTYLKLGIPYYSREIQQWLPKLKLGEQIVSLYWIQEALEALLATLTPEYLKFNLRPLVKAVGLDKKALEAALESLEGVIFSAPIGWGEIYRFNLREAILKLKLCQRVEQIFFLEDAIATLLAYLPEKDESPSVNTVTGYTLVINAGATTTELALVNLPTNPENLTYSDFYLASISAGGNDLDREIFLQLIYPQWSRNQAQLSAEINQPTDLARQERKAARLVKLILQHREQFTSQLGNRTWGVKRRDLEVRVIYPFLERINQRLNLLLSQTGISNELIETVICSGGAIATLERSLTQLLSTKFPEATVIKDTQEVRETRVATGLANLPLYPQVLERTSQQYSDLFLLCELLRIVDEESFTIEQIIQQLERRGINTNICRQRLIAILNGELPPGLIPQKVDRSKLAVSLHPNPEYQAIAAAPLFERENEFSYLPNLQQCQLLRAYFSSLLSRKKQELVEPLSLNLPSLH